MADFPPPTSNRPPSPVTTPPKTSISYHTALERSHTLNATQLKGLQNIFNRHFYTVSEKIRIENETVDAALKDLENENDEASLKDEKVAGQCYPVYVDLQRRKKVVQRKERETVELYKKYLSKYKGENKLISQNNALPKIISHLAVESVALTSIDDASVGEAEFRLTEFLREEKERIRKINRDTKIREESNEQKTFTDESRDEIDVKGSILIQDKDDYDDFSTGTPQMAPNDDSDVKVMESAKKVVDLQKETTCIHHTSSPYNQFFKESDTEEDLLDDKWVAFWSAENATLYYYNSSTSQTCWTKPWGVSIDMTPVRNCEYLNEISVAIESQVGLDDDGKHQQRNDEPRTISDGAVLHAASVGSGCFDISSKELAFNRKRALLKKHKNRRIAAVLRRIIRILIKVFGMLVMVVFIFKTKEQLKPTARIPPYFLSTSPEILSNVHTMRLNSPETVNESDLLYSRVEVNPQTVINASLSSCRNNIKGNPVVVYPTAFRHVTFMNTFRQDKGGETNQNALTNQRTMSWCRVPFSCYFSTQCLILSCYNPPKLCKPALLTRESLEQFETKYELEDKKKGPLKVILCRVPFASYFSKRCLILSRDNVEGLIDIMME